MADAIRFAAMVSALVTLVTLCLGKQNALRDLVENHQLAIVHLQQNTAQHVCTQNSLAQHTHIAKAAL